MRSTAILVMMVLGCSGSSEGLRLQEARQDGGGDDVGSPGGAGGSSVQVDANPPPKIVFDSGVANDVKYNEVAQAGKPFACDPVVISSCGTPSLQCYVSCRWGSSWNIYKNTGTEGTCDPERTPTTALGQPCSSTTHCSSDAACYTPPSQPGTHYCRKWCHGNIDCSSGQACVLDDGCPVVGQNAPLGLCAIPGLPRT